MTTGGSRGTRGNDPPNSNISCSRKLCYEISHVKDNELNQLAPPKLSSGSAPPKSSDEAFKLSAGAEFALP